MSEMILEVQKRDTVGKNHHRRLRAVGQVPAVVYGGGRDTVAIQVEQRRIDEILRSAGGENTIFLLKMKDTEQSRHAMICDLQTNAVNGKLLHVDFQRVLLDQKVKVTVQIELVGTAYGVRQEDGVLDFVTREIDVECLPQSIPQHLDLDVTELHVGDHLEASDIKLPEGVTLTTEAERVIVSITVPRRPVLDAEEEAAAEALLEAETAEPEVIKRGKAEENEAKG